MNQLISEPIEGTCGIRIPGIEAGRKAQGLQLQYRRRVGKEDTPLLPALLF